MLCVKIHLPIEMVHKYVNSLTHQQRDTDLTVLYKQ